MYVELTDHRQTPAISPANRHPRTCLGIFEEKFHANFYNSKTIISHGFSILSFVRSFVYSSELNDAITYRKRVLGVGLSAWSRRPRYILTQRFTESGRQLSWLPCSSSPFSIHTAHASLLRSTLVRSSVSTVDVMNRNQPGLASTQPVRDCHRGVGGIYWDYCISLYGHKIRGYMRLSE